MGLLSGLFAVPLLPARGALWIAEQAALLVEDEWYDAGRIRAELRLLSDALDSGRITEEEFDRAEDLLLERLQHAERRHGLRAGPRTGPGAGPRIGPGTGPGAGLRALDR